MTIENKQKLEEIMEYYSLSFIDEQDFENLKRCSKVDFIDNYGYKYNLSYSNLHCSYKRKGLLARFFNKNIYTIDNIKNYIILNKLDIELLSENISDAKDRNVKWKCLKHNEIFLKSWNAIKNGNYSCRECSKILNNKKIDKKRNDLEEIKSKALNDYDIEIISDMYINNLTPLDFICNKHRDRGVQSKTWGTIISNKLPCTYCSKEDTLKKVTKSNEQFKKEVFEVHGEKYEVISEYKNANKKVKCKCHKCGIEFKIKASHLLAGHGCGNCIKSKGEEVIERYLLDNNINYIREHRFSDCIGICRTLPFDFYLEEYNTCIEYQGVQHYKPVELFGGEKQFQIQQTNDKTKREYCKNNNIKLIEISYKDYKKIEDILSTSI